MSSKQVTISFAIAVLVALIYWGSRANPIEVEITYASFGAVESSVANTRSGTIQACMRTKLSPAIGGRIAAIYVEEGNQVKSGELLMELSNSHIKAQVARAEASLQAYRLQKHSTCIGAASDNRDAKRLATLAERELAAKDIVDRAISKADASEAVCLAAKSQEKEFQAQLQLQQALLEQTFIRAPFAGTIANINGEVGEFSTPSPPGVATPPAIDLLTSDCFYLEAPIDEVDAGLLKVGLPAKVTLDAFRGQTFSGSIRKISPYVEDMAKQARTVAVEVDFTGNEQRFLAGYSADVEVILSAKQNVLRIPTETLIDGNKLWVVNDQSVVEQVEVEVGIGNWKYTEVISGVEATDKVITSLGLSGLDIGSLVTFQSDQ
ncbi:MAG: efflux RND transporter periplasmic adaptor subunit [Kangiellaceae bacterium]|jgi:HlyD family secretion protein|nr:efflux RND transporter periplasmic adaptor subunit [Kangiellaceae bacterium]